MIEKRSLLIKYFVNKIIYFENYFENLVLNKSKTLMLSLNQRTHDSAFMPWLLSIESLNVTFHQENADYTIEVFNKLSKRNKKKKILVENI